MSHPTPPPPDLQAIYTTDPQNRNKHQVKLTWTAVTVASPAPAIVSYTVYRNGSEIGTVLASAPLEFLDCSQGWEEEYFTYYLISTDAAGGMVGPYPSICNFSPVVERYLVDLRELLKDNPPDPRVQRWSDNGLWLALRMGLSRVNAIPMTTEFNLESAPKDFFNYILVAARLAALRSQGALEAAKEFTVGAGGTTISVSRTALYNSMVSSEEAAFATELVNIKRYCTMRFVQGQGILTNALSFRIRTFSPRQYRIR